MLDNISQLKEVDPYWLDQIVSELNEPQLKLESLWRQPYPEYVSGSLRVAALLTPTGEQENFDYRDCTQPRATSLLEQLPGLQDLLLQGDLQVMGARLLRIEPGTFFHEHRDFVYMERIQRYRLHLPLITNEQAFITSPGMNVHFQRGYLWKLDPRATVHSACNFGSSSRIHLMLDCYVNDYLSELLRGQFLDETLTHRLPPLTAARKDELLAAARNLLDESREDNDAPMQEAEELLLKTFCQYDLIADSHLTSYDLLFQLYQSPAHERRRQYWQERFHEVYAVGARPAVALPA